MILKNSYFHKQSLYFHQFRLHIQRLYTFSEHNNNNNWVVSYERFAFQLLLIFSTTQMWPVISWLRCDSNVAVISWLKCDSNVTSHFVTQMWPVISSIIRGSGRPRVTTQSRYHQQMMTTCPYPSNHRAPPLSGRFVLNNICVDTDGGVTNY